MSEKPPSVFRRLRRKFKTEKDPVNGSKLSAASTPTVQSRDASPSRTAAHPTALQQTDSVNIANGPELPQTKEPNLETLPSTAAERLWDEAYDAIKHEDAKLVEGYERILSQYLQGHGSTTNSDTSPPNAIIAGSPDARRQQMNELIRTGLDKTAREAKVKDGLGTAMGIVLSLKDMVSTAISAVPQASIAWSGVCIALGVLESAVKETASNRDGIEYVITRIRWYGNVSSVLIDESTLDGAALSGMKSELEKRLVELYKALLLYQMKSVCSYHRNRGYGFLRDLIKLDNWAVSVQNIQKAEDSLRQDAEVYGSQQSRSRLELIANHAKTQESEIKSIAKALEEQLRRQISAEDQTCLRELWSHDPYTEKKRIEDTKGGFLQDSFNWILENDHFCQWFEDPSRPLLWIRGDPGKGKTMLLCGIVDNLQKLAPSSLVAFFFCQATDERINNSISVLRGLIFSLVDQQRHLLKHLREHYARQGKSLFEPPSAWYALSDILQSLLSELNNNQKPTCLLVDALDECVNEDMSRLLDFIVKMSNEFPYVKWVVSSRNWPQIIDKLESLGPQAQLSLELNANSVASAVQIYIKQKVSRLSESKGYKKDREEAVRKYLLENADGTFLWVALVCQNLQRVSAWNALSKLKAYPPGLDPFYQQMVNGLAKSGEAEICKRILAVVTVARQPLTLQELIALAETPGELDEKIPAICDLIAQCGSFLTIRDEVVYFVHQSAKDFLVGTKTEQTLFLEIAKVNDYMVSRSIDLMSELLTRDMYNLSDLDIHIDDAQALDPNPLTTIGYSCVFWIDHFVESITSKENTTTREDILQTLVDDAKTFIERKYLFWLEALSLLRRIPEGIMAMRKLHEICKKEMRYDSTGLIRDAYRFILAAKQIIESFPLQIHPSALLICPIESRIRHQSLENPATFFETKHGMQIGWDSCVQIIDTGVTPGLLAISPDGKLLASMTATDIRIWDVATGSRLKTLEYPKKDYSHNQYLLFSPSGQHLAAVDEKWAWIFIWDIASSEPIQRLEGYMHLGCNLSFSPDEKHLASGSDEDTIIIWDLATGKRMRTLKNTERVILVSFSLNGKLLVSCSIGGSIKIWDDTGKCIQEKTLDEAWKSIPNRHLKLRFSPDLSLLAFLDPNDNIKILDLSSFQYIKVIKWDRPYYGDPCMTFLPNGQLAVLAKNDGGHGNCINVWDINTNKVLRTLRGHIHQIHSVEASPDGSQLISVSRLDRTIRIWDIDPEAADSNMWEGHEEYYLPMAFSTDGSKFALASRENSITILDTATSSHVQTLIGHQGVIDCIDISSDGKLLASASSDNSVKIWNIAENACIQTLEGYTGQITSVKFSPDSQRLASASYARLSQEANDHTIRIWDLATSSYLTLIDCGYVTPKSIHFSQDGKILVSGSDYGTVKVWETIAGKCIQTWQHPMSSDFGYKSLSTAISLDGKTIASNSAEFLKIWSEIEGKYECVQTLKQHDRYATQVTFSPDGRQLISGSSTDNTTNVWSFDNLPGSEATRRTLQCDQNSFLTTAFSETGSPVASELCLYGLDTKRLWVTRNGHKILYLPDDIRLGTAAEFCFMVHGRTVAILGGNNKLVMLVF
ncbi:quinon protein alcohol dehydrogenase-like superfamily [Trichoderma afarasin]